MTCIVGFVKDKVVYMGADSLGSTSSSKTVRKDSKIFKLGNVIIGATSSYRMIQLLQYKFEVPKHPGGMSVDKYMRTLFIDEVISCFTKNAFTEVEKNVISGGFFLVGYSGKLYRIESDFQVGENVCLYDACGSGQYYAMGAMCALLNLNKNIDPKKLLTLALESAETHACGVEGPFKIMSTQ